MDEHGGDFLHFLLPQLAPMPELSPQQPQFAQVGANDEQGRGKSRVGGSSARGAARRRRVRTCRQRAQLLDELIEILAGRMAHPDADSSSTECEDSLTQQLALVNANLAEGNQVLRVGVQELFLLRHRVSSSVVPSLQSIAQEIGNNTAVIADFRAIISGNEPPALD